MPSRAAPPSLLRRGNRPIELVGSRAAKWPTTMAVCPSRKLVAVATDAGGGGSPRVDLVRLWREKGEQEFRRPLKAIASIRDDSSGYFHRRLAWSRGGATSEYPLGLLAAGLDGGEVHIWDPSRLLYEPNIDDDIEELFGGKRFSWVVDDGGYSSCCLHVVMHDMDGRPKCHTVIEEPPENNFKDEVKEGIADMKLRLDHLIEDHLTKDRPGQVALPKLKNHDFEDDWHILEKEEIVVKAHGQEKDPWNGLVLKLNTLAGPVYGLSFNHHYPSMLACAAFGEKIRIYYLDHPHELTSRGKERLNTQMTFLDWSPINPAILASTCDIGETKIWDLRENGSKSTYAQELSCSEVHWNPCNPMMFAVTSTVDCKSPVKIWDVRNKFEALHKFGNGKGVTSLSWSASGLITTTDIDGAIDCWTKDENGEPVSCSSLATGSIEARWCESDATTATISPLHVEVYRMPAGQCIWQDPHFPDPY